MQRIRGVDIPKSMKQIRSQLTTIELQQFPQLSSISENCLLAVNQRYCQNENEILQLNERTEIAVIPPISGG
jgi:molybdopterin converting factor small subunit